MNTTICQIIALVLVMQILKSFDNYFTANIWMGKLKAEGMQCFLKDEHSVTIDPILTSAIGGIKLMVQDIDFPKAYELLKEFEAEFCANLVCPRCLHKGMNYISRPEPKTWLTSIASLFFKVYANAVEYIYACPECHFESTTAPDATHHS